MAVYKDLVVKKEDDLESLMKKLYRWSEELRHTFANLDDDNMGQNYLDHRVQRDDRIREITWSSDGLKIRFENLETQTETSLEQAAEHIKLLVAKGDVVETMLTRMELYAEHIELHTGQVVFDTNNFQLDINGNGTFSGNVTGGTISIGERFAVDALGNAYINGSITVGLLNPRDEVSCGELEVDNSDGVVNVVVGDISCDELYVSEQLSCQRVRFRSDSRLKEDVQTLGYVSRILEGIQPVTFRWSGTDRRDLGFIAQDMGVLQGDLPLVGGGEYLEIPYASYAALWAAGIQENQIRINALRERVMRRG